MNKEMTKEVFQDLIDKESREITLNVSNKIMKEYGVNTDAIWASIGTYMACVFKTISTTEKLDPELAEAFLLEAAQGLKRFGDDFFESRMAKVVEKEKV